MSLDIGGRAPLCDWVLRTVFGVPTLCLSLYSTVCLGTVGQM